MPRPPEASENAERKVLECWRNSASHWQQLIEHNRLASRAITNPAIEQAILAHRPKSVLDIGCGEGWLARRLAASGIQVCATDAVDRLVGEARRLDSLSEYHCLSYDALPGPLAGQQFDLAVCNFSLFGDQSVSTLLVTLRSLLTADGHLLIQTLHPITACQGDYREGWRSSEWQGLDKEGERLGEAPPWYFRPLASWLTLLGQHGRVVEVQEPLDPTTRLPLSLLFHVQLRPQQASNKQ